ncbi:putative alpha-beta hydrolase superfamily patatin-like phospholipase domain [Bradyrhizobium sp. ORS 285]|uniref:patatin-like phospholipase family protein n=1 Tax=Bradyrhizobium sp. ORS 285 TaxID=115808 RepID=UPI0002FC2A22|nr:patatin-like phospholipase family protein [Bradyrhizobium sp. ORS 285]SMX60521.1 putative alpha-beta hydrolase superfamily patatin-like phospholipase domain [Bradyrhizobium sp. ORS 285]
MRSRSVVAAGGLVGLCSLLLLLGGCASVEQRAAYSADDAKRARIEGFQAIRMWADAPAESFDSSSFKPQPQPGKPFAYLALSGGGGDGAFGAGILNGWSESGARPEFTVVSGVSTGALIAPFAFLGPAYDPTLKEMYTSGLASSFAASPNALGALFGSSVFDGQPLRDAIAHYTTPELLEAIAREHARGRRLFVVTTDLDAARPVLWNMGEIASARTPRSLQLFRQVLTASASVPVAFPPALIAASSDGKPIEEMHVDGGVSTQVFTFPDRLLMQTGSSQRLAAKPAIYIIMNGRTSPDFQPVENSTKAIAIRSLDMKSKREIQSYLSATYQFARRNGMAFNMTAIDQSVPESQGIGFDTDYMRTLYALGYDSARSGRFWTQTPPVP